MLKAIIRYRLIFLVFALLSLSLLTVGCNYITGEGYCNTPTDVDQQIFDVTVQKAHDLIRENAGNPDFIILDVRTPAEYSSGHIEDAINIDVNSGSFISEVEALDKDSTYLVYCRSGIRSASARDTMAQLGFLNIYNMNGGITEWQSAGFPVVR